MKKLSILICFLTLYLSSQAQYATVVFDFEKSTFNENQPLPAETNMMFTGEVDRKVQMIEVLFYKAAGSGDKNALYTSSWKRSYNNISETFNLPINYKLKGGQKYDIEVRYFRPLTTTEKSNLKTDLFGILDSYVDLTYKSTAKKITLTKQHNNILQDINSIVSNGLELYRSRNSFVFEGYSDIVKLKLKQIEEVNLKKEKRLSEKDNGRAGQSKDKLISELKQILRDELKLFLNNNLQVLEESKRMYDYGVEKTSNVMALNAGYAAAFFDSKFKDLDYGSSVYVGISVPLANREFKSAFLSNTSVSAGVFLQNMEDNDGNKVTGPFIERPFYLGFGYRVIKFIRLNAGAVLLEKQLPTTDKVMVRPFVGASIDINFWMGIGDK